MRILICSSEYPPEGSGIAKVILGIIEAINKTNIEIVACSPSGPDIFLGNSKLIEKTGILGLLYFWIRVAFFIKRTNWDVVWLHNPIPAVKIPLKSIICTYHSTYFGIREKMQLTKNILRHYYQICAIIEKICIKNIPNGIFVGVSSQVCNELKKIQKNIKPLLILNGVDTNRFSPSKSGINTIKDGVFNNNQVILFVGRLDPTKFVDSIIIAYQAIKNMKPLTKLIIIGDGPQKEYLIKLAQELCISDSIIFLGYQPNENLPQYFNIADVVVCPYSGLVLFEAMASSKPIVAYDVEWHSEVITHLNNGILVENLNHRELANAVVFLLDNPELCNVIGKRAREYTQNNLDWSIISNKYLSLFTTISKNHFDE
ncbi:MAG: glycosyltransferase family 4 protein [Methanomicrobiales archaeon]|nr:glycosyltransferase family 4 protein [Methanomicrobiales archaeon]